MKEVYMHSHKVYFDDVAQHGAYHLQHNMNDQEARVFFDQAKIKGHIVFEDLDHRHYTLTHNPDGTYGLEHKIY